MPELPEVETIRRDLSKRVIGKKITKVVVIKKKLVKSPLKSFVKTLTGNSFTRLDRRAKLLAATLKKGEWFLLIHLKMTGQLLYKRGRSVSGGGHPQPPPGTELPNKFSYIIFDFADHSRLYFNDVRQFGYMKLVDRKGKEKIFSKYGLEPLAREFTLKAFRDLVQRKKTVIKKVLTDQKRIAGIGNIYADEACFAARILPMRPVGSLSELEIKRLYSACRTVLKRAVAKRGTTFRDFRDASGARGNFVKYLKVYGRAGQKCLRCKKFIIKKSRLGGRGTAYCAVCQK